MELSDGILITKDKVYIGFYKKINMWDLDSKYSAVFFKDREEKYIEHYDEVWVLSERIKSMMYDKVIIEKFERIKGTLNAYRRTINDYCFIETTTKTWTTSFSASVSTDGFVARYSSPLTSEPPKTFDFEEYARDFTRDIVFPAKYKITKKTGGD